jgi:YjbE family integral membrane protein
MDFLNLSPDALAAFGQVIMIDLVLAGDNAVVIGLAAAGLPPERRQRAILVGVIAATLLRVVFAAFAIQLLNIVGLLLAGGVLLLWVAWRMWRELRERRAKHADPDAAVAQAETTARHKTFAQAAWQIVLADVSMSLDNVLAVAGAARDHFGALVFGLALSIVLMGFAASIIARLLNRHRWIAYVGLAIIVYVACDMIWRGSLQIQAHAFGG